jgi:hypothetical protein
MTVYSWNDFEEMTAADASPAPRDATVAIWPTTYAGYGCEVNAITPEALFERYEATRFL